MCSGGFCDECEGQALALRGPGARFFRCLARDRPSHYGDRVRFFCSAGACPPQSLPHPGHPDNPGHPASDAINIKVLSDLLCLFLLRFYRHSGPIGPATEFWVTPVARGPVPRQRSAV